MCEAFECDGMVRFWRRGRRILSGGWRHPSTMFDLCMGQELFSLHVLSPISTAAPFLLLFVLGYHARKSGLRALGPEARHLVVIVSCDGCDSCAS